MLGISAAAFKARLFRARRQLLHQAQRALEISTRKKTPSAFLPKKNVAPPLGPGPSDTSLLEVSYL
jgi:hypothetical protein